MVSLKIFTIIFDVKTDTIYAKGGPGQIRVKQFFHPKDHMKTYWPFCNLTGYSLNHPPRTKSEIDIH